MGQLVAHGSCADARYLGREFVPQAEILSFASPKESIQRKGDPTVAPSAALRVPCASRAMRPLRNSPAAERLAQTVLADPPHYAAMLGALYGSSSVVAPAAVAAIGRDFCGAVKALGMGRGFVGRTSVRRAAGRSARLTNARSTSIRLQALSLLPRSLACRPIPERAAALPYD
jgi:hypothetical protein